MTFQYLKCKTFLVKTSEHSFSKTEQRHSHPIREIFNGKFISRKGNINSDLSPIDFSSWGYLKSKANVSNPSSLAQLRDKFSLRNGNRYGVHLPSRGGKCGVILNERDCLHLDGVIFKKLISKLCVLIISKYFIENDFWYIKYIISFEPPCISLLPKTTNVLLISTEYVSQKNIGTTNFGVNKLYHYQQIQKGWDQLKLYKTELEGVVGIGLFPESSHRKK